MEEVLALLRDAWAVWKNLPLGEIERKCVAALVTGIFFYAVVLVVERICAARTNNYRSREFFHDTVYWFYYRSGLNWILFMALLFTSLDEHPSVFDLNLLAPYPIWVRAVAFLMIAEFFGYWWHRANHHFKFLWAFHSMHHAPRSITFATSARFHPVEIFLQYCWYYVLIRICGGNALTWLPIVMAMEIVLEAQHTQIPWKLGPLYKFVVTPTYHAYHHSTDPAHHNRNFAVIFSFWDYVFGTAVPDDSPAPKRLGLDDATMPTLLSTLVTPFRLALEFYGLVPRSASPRSEDSAPHPDVDHVAGHR